jgi:hypothetical protein
MKGSIPLLDDLAIGRMRPEIPSRRWLVDRAINLGVHVTERAAEAASSCMRRLVGPAETKPGQSSPPATLARRAGPGSVVGPRSVVALLRPDSAGLQFVEARAELGAEDH